MPKRLLLVAEEGPVKQLDESQDSVNYILKNRFPDLVFKVMSYDPDYPEDVTYHLGQTVKFVSNSKFMPNGESHGFDEPSEEAKGIRAMMDKLWQGSKPALKDFAKEIWYSKEDYRKLKEKEHEEKQRLLDQSTPPLDKISKEAVKLKENGN